MLFESNFTNIIKTVILGHVGEKRPIVNDLPIILRHNISEENLKIPDPT